MTKRSSILSSVSVLTAAVLWAGCGDSSTSPAMLEVMPATPAPGGSSPTSGPASGPGADGGSGGADASVADPASISSAVAAYDAALAAAVCQRLASCCSPANTAAFFQQYMNPPYDLKTTPSAAECVTSLTVQLGKLHQKWAASAALGRMSFRPVRGQACVTGVSGAMCGAPLTSALFDSACFGTRGNEVFVKLTPIGAACKDIKDGTFYGE